MFYPINNCKCTSRFVRVDNKTVRSRLKPTMAVNRCYRGKKETNNNNNGNNRRLGGFMVRDRTGKTAENLGRSKNTLKSFL